MRLRIQALILVSLFTPACAKLAALNQMKLPDGIDSAQQLMIDGPSAESMSTTTRDIGIGAYRVTDIDRSGWTHGRGRFSLMEGYKHTRHTKFSFAVRAQGRTLEAGCVSSRVARDEHDDATASYGLECECMEGSTLRAKLELNTSPHDRRLSGDVKVGDSGFGFSPTNHRQSGLDSPDVLGFTIKSASAVGALEVRGGGRAFLPAGLSEDQQLGMICSYGAVLLYQPVGD